MKEELPKLRESLHSFPDWVRDETEGLDIEQMAFAAREPAWARWSIELQIRHIALGPPVWLSRRAGEVLLKAGYIFPDSAEAIAKLDRAGVRFVPAEIVQHRNALIAFLRPWADLCCTIIDREGPEGLQSLTFSFLEDRPVGRRSQNDPKRAIDYHRILARLHPSGYTEDPDRPGLFHLHVGGVLRNIHWNVLAHLRTIQRLKNFMGLSSALELPREGYLTLSEFYD